MQALVRASFVIIVNVCIPSRVAIPAAPSDHHYFACLYRNPRHLPGHSVVGGDVTLRFRRVIVSLRDTLERKLSLVRQIARMLHRNIATLRARCWLFTLSTYFV